MLQNIHCHDIMLSFAKQCTLHSSIVENTFHFAKLPCKLGQSSIFSNDLIRFLRQVGLSILAMLRKHGTAGILNAICMFTSEFQFAFTLRTTIKKTIIKHMNKDITESLIRSILKLINNS